MAHLRLHCCDGFRWTWEDEFVRNTRAMVPEPNDDPKPDDDEEIDDEPDDEPDEESDDKPNDEPDDEPGTLYFGERLMDGPIVLQPDSTPAARRSGYRGPRGVDSAVTR